MNAQNIAKVRMSDGTWGKVRHKGQEVVEAGPGLLERNGCVQTLGEAEWRQAGPGPPGPGDGKETEVGHGGK